MKPEIIAVVGKSDSGKTTLLEKLIPEMKKRGHRIGVVKHAHHGFDMDKKGKDSWRHRKAGADASLLVSPGRIGLIKNQEPGSVQELKTYLSDMDLIITEGFKREKLPKIEIFRKGGRHKDPLCMEDSNLAAFVTDSDYAPDVPIFRLDAIEALADFLEKQFISTP
ncbi:MAG: molybdopterin-guanine dinucleotide biosynthesis protein B [Desulfobacteraceae bacterium]